MDNLFTKIYKSLFITFLMISSASAKSFNSDSTNHVPLRTYKETRVSPSQNNQNQALSCPAPFSLGNIQQRRDVYKARDLDGNEHITGYGPWVETSRNCHRNITQNQTLSCPANQRGTWTQVRNYIEYYNGNVGGDTGWQTNVNTCDYYFIETRYNYTSGACPASYAGSTTLRQSYDYWSDGSSRNVSGWVTSANNCVPAVVEFVTPNEFFNPPRKGRDFGRGQTYGPYTVTSQGITMTLYYNIYSVVQGKRYVCTGQGGMLGMIHVDTKTMVILHQT